MIGNKLTSWTLYSLSQAFEEIASYDCYDSYRGNKNFHLVDGISTLTDDIKSYATKILLNRFEKHGDEGPFKEILSTNKQEMADFITTMIDKTSTYGIVNINDTNTVVVISVDPIAMFNDPDKAEAARKELLEDGASILYNNIVLYTSTKKTDKAYMYSSLPEKHYHIIIKLQDSEDDRDEFSYLALGRIVVTLLYKLYLNNNESIRVFYNYTELVRMAATIFGQAAFIMINCKIAVCKESSNLYDKHINSYADCLKGMYDSLNIIFNDEFNPIDELSTCVDDSIYEHMVEIMHRIQTDLLSINEEAVSNPSVQAMKIIENHINDYLIAMKTIFASDIEGDTTNNPQIHCISGGQ